MFNQFCDVLVVSTHPNNMKISGDHLSALEWWKLKKEKTLHKNVGFFTTRDQRSMRTIIFH
jgi:hypothetical protein